MTNEEYAIIIKLCGYDVENHNDGKYTVTNPLDVNGWRIVNSDYALEETYKMLLYTGEIEDLGWYDAYHDNCPNDILKNCKEYMSGYDQGNMDS